MISWASRFELRQYVKGSLWVLPLLGMVLGAVLAQGTLWLDGAVRRRALDLFALDGQRRAHGDRRGDGRPARVRRDDRGARRAAGDGHALAAVHAAVVSRQAAEGVLATFAGTFTFAFSLLRRVDDDFVPDIGVTRPASPSPRASDCC